jgi:FkbM family methyltransferase
MAATTQPAPKTFQLTEQQCFDLRKQLVQHVRVDDGHHQYEFRCETAAEVWRARTLTTKEAGTVAWIDTFVKPGEVFYDVGANIGLYTLLAGKRVGAEGMVYAFEPHVANVGSLLHNVSRNGVAPWTKIMSCALNDREGFFDFNYYQTDAGSSMSQLNDHRDANDQSFQPAFAEYKYATTVDRLIEMGAIRAADHIKIDVDGNEMLVLQGMHALLTRNDGPRSVQVEINARFKADVYQFMDRAGYSLAMRHDTALGKAALARGQDPESIGYNAIFTKAAGSPA